jgi:hypothetical protein
MPETKASGMCSSVDMSEKAKQADITVPVTLSDSLVKKMRPNQFLMKLGISFDKRMANLFEIVRANLQQSDDGKIKEKSFTVPFIVVNGPIVNEVVLTAVVRVEKNNKDEQTIFITDLLETDSELED